MLAVLAAAVVVVPTGCGTTGSEPVTPDHAAPTNVGRAIRAVQRPVAIAGRPRARPLPPPPLATSERTASKNALTGARHTAARFFASYARFLYGALPARNVSGVSPRLRSELRHGRVLVTPAERTAAPRVIRVTVAAAGPPVSAGATATVLAHRRRYQLIATLEPRHGGWVVVSVG